MSSLGRYEILEQIGAGSMGTVYRAMDSALEREVALKIIRTSGTVDAEIRERFYREAKACARLQHPNIIGVYDLGEVDRVAYIAMELLRGADFRKLIEERQPLGVAEKIEAMVDVCEGLDHAHRHGVIHRDVKPSNLFLQDKGRAKIMDFGIARLPSSKLTINGNVLGTPNYMAPEQIQGNPSDARSDLFSVGLVFFELLVYVHPFHGEVIARRITDGDPDSLFDHDSTVPVLLEKILNRALARDPDARYGSGAELGRDLRAVLDGIRMNATPRMSTIILPSERTGVKAEPRIGGDPTLLKPAPAGEDPAEWRLSEVLRLSLDFEEAVEPRDEAAARSALEQLKAIAAVDSRFVETAESYQNSYVKIWGSSEPKPGPEPQPPLPGLSKGAQTAAPKYLRWHITPEQRKVFIASVIACTLLVLLGWFVSDQFGTVKLEPALGTLRVQAARAAIREAPRPDSRQIVEVTKGDYLRLLDLPANKSVGWIRVQASPGGELTAPGCIAMADISDWTEWVFENPASEAKLVLMMNPGENASDAQLQPYVDKLRALESRLQRQPEAQQVRTEAEKLDKVIASRKPPSPLAPGEEPPEPPPEQPKPPPTADQLVWSGRRALESYSTTLDSRSLRNARYFAREALKLDENHRGAQELWADIGVYEKTVAP